VTSNRRGWPPRHKRLRAVLDGAQLGQDTPRYRWAGTLERLADHRHGMPPEAWYRVERAVQLRWAGDGESRPRQLSRRDVREFAAMCHVAATPDESIDGQLVAEREAFAGEISKAAHFLAERLSRDDVQRSQAWGFEPVGCTFGDFVASLTRLREHAEAWASAPAWPARRGATLIYFAHSLREQMRERWRPRRPDWQLIHAAALAALGHDLGGIGPEQLPAHVRRITAASRPRFEPGG